MWVLVIRHFACTNYSMWLLKNTWMRFDSCTCAEAWNPPLSLAIMFVYNNELWTDVSSHVCETDLLYYRRKLPSYIKYHQESTWPFSVIHLPLRLQLHDNEVSLLARSLKCRYSGMFLLERDAKRFSPPYRFWCCHSPSTITSIEYGCP